MKAGGSPRAAHVGVTDGALYCGSRRACAACRQIEKYLREIETPGARWRRLLRESGKHFAEVFGLYQFT